MKFAKISSPIEYSGPDPSGESLIPEHIARAAVADLIDGLHEKCGISRPGAEHTLGAFNEWLTWGSYPADLARWADDGGPA